MRISHLSVRSISRYCCVASTEKSPANRQVIHSAGDILLFDDVAVLYKRVGDLIMAVTGCQTENELILHSVLTAMAEALTILLRCDTLLCSRCIHCSVLYKHSVRTLHSLILACLDRQPESFCRDVVNKKSVLENLDLVLITIDETIDQGCDPHSFVVLAPCEDFPSAISQPTTSLAPMHCQHQV